MTISIREIQQVVARHFGLDMLDILSDRRGDAMRPRHIAMYLARRLTTKSLPQIGISFNRDHSTVHWSVKRIEEQRLVDEDLDLEVAMLARRALGQHEHALAQALIGWAA